MNSSSVGFALVGVGRWGTRWFETLRQHPRVDLRWACDVGWQRAVRRQGVQLTPAIEQVLADPRVSVVVVATPPETHAEVALRVVRAGRHVVVEKPLVTDLRSLARLEAACERSDSRCWVNHLLVFHPAFQVLERAIDLGRIGRVQRIYGVRASLGAHRTDCAWWTLGPHDLSLIERVAPSVLTEELRVQGNRTEVTAELRSEAHTASLSFAVGGASKRRWFAVQGTEGTLVFDDTQKEPLRVSPRTEPIDVEAVARGTSLGWLDSARALVCTKEPPLDVFVRHVVDGIMGSVECRSGLREARTVVEALVRGRPFVAASSSPGSGAKR